MYFIKNYILLFIISFNLMVLSLPLNESNKNNNEKPTAVNGECDPVNSLLKKEKSNNCCLEEGIACENGHVTKM